MKKSNLYLLFVVATGLFLRVYRILSNYYFTGELGKELLYMGQFAQSHTLPLTGMATSHEWLSYGPFYYWIMIPLFNLFNGNPFILFWSSLFVAATGLFLNYFVMKKISDEKVALFSTIVQALSPLLIWQTRLSKLHVFFWMIMPIFTYLLYLLWNGKKKLVFWAGLVFGLLFSFHFSQIPLLGVVFILFWIKRNIYKFKDWLLFMAGVLLPNITLIWQDKSLALWLPYRVINFANKNSNGTWSSFLEYFGKNIFWDNRLWILGILLIVPILIHYVYTNRFKLKEEFLPFFLTSSIFLTLFANILHGSPPVHYFLPIFTILPIVLGIYLSKVKLWPLIVTPILFVNLISFNQDPLFYANVSNFVPDIVLVPYSLQETVASFIVSDSKGNEISIKRTGPYDYFPEQYSQNYKYLVLWKGGNLKEKTGIVYTINENIENKTVTIEK